ncbi:DegT/DnrJ/EryC1/StrS family aminotransferase [Patescibacteria group bacterium]
MNTPLFWPQQYKSEWLESLAQVFDTRWLGQGPLADRFEKEFGEKFGYEYCLSVNSGSAALELAYHLAGIGAGDEVITPVLTCTATNLPLLRRGASIIFADINDNLVIDYNDVAKKVTPKTKAIVVVTLGGLPVDERIFNLAESFNIPVIVDAAQSLGISETRGEYICYSFQAIKHFTTGDGGMLIVKNEEEYKRAKKLRWFGIDREAKNRVDFNCLVNREITMDIEEPGFKYHMADIVAALGLVGLRHTDEILNYRKKICEYYAKNMPANIKCIYGGSYWLFAILTKNRNATLESLRSSGVECDLVQLRNDIFKVFGGKRQDLPNMNRIENEYMYIPLHGKITHEDADRVVNFLYKQYENN